MVKIQEVNRFFSKDPIECNPRIINPTEMRLTKGNMEEQNEQA